MMALHVFVLTGERTVAALNGGKGEGGGGTHSHPDTPATLPLSVHSNF